MIVITDAETRDARNGVLGPLKAWRRHAVNLNEPFKVSLMVSRFGEVSLYILDRHREHTVVILLVVLHSSSTTSSPQLNKNNLNCNELNFLVPLLFALH